jgi:hypothetical protein
MARTGRKQAFNGRSSEVPTPPSGLQHSISLQTHRHPSCPQVLLETEDRMRLEMENGGG